MHIWPPLSTLYLDFTSWSSTTTTLTPIFFTTTGTCFCNLCNHPTEPVFGVWSWTRYHHASHYHWQQPGTSWTCKGPVSVEKSWSKWPLRGSNGYLSLCSERYLTRTVLNILSPAPIPFGFGCLRLPRRLSRTPFSHSTPKTGSCGSIQVESWFCGVLLSPTQNPTHGSQFLELWPTKTSSASPDNLLWCRANWMRINDAKALNKTSTYFFSRFHGWENVAILRIFFKCRYFFNASVCVQLEYMQNKNAAKGCALISPIRWEPAVNVSHFWSLSAENAQNGHAPTHMGVPTAVTLGLCMAGIHLTCQGWRGEKVRGSQHAYWMFQKRNRAKILTFCCPVN